MYYTLQYNSKNYYICSPKLVYQNPFLLILYIRNSDEEWEGHMWLEISDCLFILIVRGGGGGMSKELDLNLETHIPLYKKK